MWGNAFRGVNLDFGPLLCYRNCDVRFRVTGGAETVRLLEERSARERHRNPGYPVRREFLLSLWSVPFPLSRDAAGTTWSDTGADTRVGVEPHSDLVNFGACEFLLSSNFSRIRSLTRWRRSILPRTTREQSTPPAAPSLPLRLLPFPFPPSVSPSPSRRTPRTPRTRAPSTPPARSTPAPKQPRSPRSVRPF